MPIFLEDHKKPANGPILLNEQELCKLDGESGANIPGMIQLGPLRHWAE